MPFNDRSGGAVSLAAEAKLTLAGQADRQTVQNERHLLCLLDFTEGKGDALPNDSVEFNHKRHI